MDTPYDDIAAIYVDAREDYLWQTQNIKVTVASDPDFLNAFVCGSGLYPSSSNTTISAYCSPPLPSVQYVKIEKTAVSSNSATWYLTIQETVVMRTSEFA